MAERTMEHASLNGTLYQFDKDFKHNEALRQSFNAMTEAHFGFSLEDWYQRGYWGNYYVPYSLLHEDQIVSNVSINKLEVLIDNEVKSGIQIGTVMTDKEYRKRGLNKFLLEQVMDDWKDRADFIYLFANDTVLDFYPKFGFEPLQEYQFSRPVSSNSTPSLRKLNIGHKEDAALLIQAVSQAVPISRISVRNHAPMILFYGLSVMRDSFYYLQESDAIIVADYEGDTLFLHDVFTQTSADLDLLIQQLSGRDIKKVVLGFTPMDTSGFEESVVHGPDTLFMLKNQASLFKNKHWMFPVLSHA